jgi:uncharacterized protein (TIGR02646 family)
MRRLQRLPLSPETLEFLQERTRAVTGAADPKAEVDRLWKLQTARAFVEIRATLRRMASGLERCMYCEDSEGTDIEHFWPKSAYPERAFDWHNYLFGCSRCNSNFKRGRFPLDDGGQPLLINPTEEEPLEHLRFLTRTGNYAARTPKGDSSIDVFGLNRTTLPMGRRRAWTILLQLLPRYAQLKRTGRDAEAEEVAGVFRTSPFSGVLAAFLRIAAGPAAGRLISPECLAVLHTHPEISTWL